MKAFLLLSFITSSFISTLAMSASVCAPLVGTCDYYKCVSQKLICGAQDYPLDFGYHYCHAFDLNTASFSAKGQAFLANVKTCLQRKIETRPIRVCGDVKAGAPSDHLDCYTRARFCALSFSDQAAIGQIVFATMIGDPAFRATAMKISQSCGYLP